MNKKIINEKMGFFLFFLCWIVYFTSYIGRVNYSSVMASMIDDKILDLPQAGTVSMVYFFAYAIGQLINGILADKTKAQWMIFIGLVLSGIANSLMGLVPVYPWLLVFWGVNGYTQAMIWPPIIRIIAEKYTEEKKMKYAIDFSTSMVLGTLASYLLSACILKFAEWKFAFYLPACMLVIVAVIWMIGYGYVARFVEANGVVVEPVSHNKEKVDKIKNGSLKEILLGSGLLVIIMPVIMHGVIKDGVTQWVPTYIYERFDVTASFSVIITMILPIFNLAGAYMARWADLRHPRKEVHSSIIFFTSATTALVLLLTVGKYQVLLTALLFAVITSSIMAVNSLFINLVPLHFEKQGSVATVSGFLNAIAYLGSAISTYAISVLVEKFGWNFTICMWIGITVIALICVVVKRDSDIEL